MKENAFEQFCLAKKKKKGESIEKSCYSYIVTQYFALEISPRVWGNIVHNFEIMAAKQGSFKYFNFQSFTHKWDFCDIASNCHF